MKLNKLDADLVLQIRCDVQEECLEVSSRMNAPLVLCAACACRATMTAERYYSTSSSVRSAVDKYRKRRARSRGN